MSGIQPVDMMGLAGIVRFIWSSFFPVSVSTSLQDRWVGFGRAAQQLPPTRSRNIMNSGTFLTLLFLLLWPEFGHQCEEPCESCLKSVPFWRKLVEPKKGKEVMKRAYCNEESLGEMPCLRAFCKQIDENVRYLRNGMKTEQICKANGLCSFW
ncbi:hypothetical protein GCK32_015258 [Trichostrongylus colubriformis]|uniref:Uncharacterized protein n=1 Tax=Trichostrongylus colubriformis TaxID=6319 RepID=A0AAN8FU47_TRICO